MAFKLGSATGNQKKYFYLAVDTGPFGRIWHYVTADTPGAVETSGYFNATTNDDHAYAVESLRVGDLVLVYQVAAITDTQTLEADAAGGIVDMSLHAVLTNTGTVVNLSGDLLEATVTYTGA